MTGAHPSGTEFAWYVTCGLDRGPGSRRVRRFERHVSDCSRCCDRLAAEATFELALGPHEPAPATAGRRAWFGAAGLAAAAALAFAVWRGPAPESSRDRPVAAPVTTDAGVEVAFDSGHVPSP